jgi:hypothetical protein
LLKPLGYTTGQFGKNYLRDSMMKDHVQFLEARKDATKGFKRRNAPPGCVSCKAGGRNPKVRGGSTWRYYRIMVAEDSVQETLLRAGRYRDSVKEGALLRQWLCRVATNACLESMPVVWFPA